MAVTEEVLVKRLTESLKKLGVTDTKEQASILHGLYRTPGGVVVGLFNLEDDKMFVRQEEEFRTHVQRLRRYFKALKFASPVKTAIMFVNKLGQNVVDPLSAQLLVIMTGYGPAETSVEKWVALFVGHQIVEAAEQEVDLDVLRKLARSLTKLPIQCAYFGNLPKLVGEMTSHGLVIRFGAWLAGGPELHQIDKLAIQGHVGGLDDTAWQSPNALLSAFRKCVDPNSKLAQTLKDQETAISYAVYQLLVGVTEEILELREAESA